MEADIMQDDMQTGISSEGMNADRTSERRGYPASIIAARVFTWIPGTSPVKVPMAAPNRDMYRMNSTTSNPTVDIRVSGVIKGRITVSELTRTVRR